MRIRMMMGARREDEDGMRRGERGDEAREALIWSLILCRYRLRVGVLYGIRKLKIVLYFVFYYWSLDYLLFIFYMLRFTKYFVRSIKLFIT